MLCGQMEGKREIFKSLSGKEVSLLEGECQCEIPVGIN